MHDPVTLEQALEKIASLRRVIELKSRSITWLETKLIHTESCLTAEKDVTSALLEERRVLQARVAVYSAQNDRLSERVFMCENEPSAS